MATSARVYTDNYKPWAQFLESKLNELEPSTAHSWGQLQLFLINEVDKQCAEKLRAGRHDLFANIAELYKKFKIKWQSIEPNIKRDIPKAETILNETHRDVFLPCLFQHLLDVSLGDPTGRKMLRVYDRHRIRSNAFELISYLLQLRQRLKENAPIPFQPMLTHMIKVDSVPRMRPNRNVDFVNRVERYLEDFKLDDFACSDWEVLRSKRHRLWLLDLWKNFLTKIDIQKIAPFQWRCFKAFLNDALKSSPSRVARDPAIITAGTGFGKTEAFLFPILFFSTINLVRQRSNRNSGPDALLLYPRIDLCNNQLERCLWYTFCLREALKETEGTDTLLENHIKLPFRIAIAHGGLRRISGSALPFSIICPICQADQTEGKIMLRKEVGGWGYGAVKPFCTFSEDHAVEDYLALKLDKKTGYFSIAITTVDTLHRRLMDVNGTKSLWRNKKVLPRFVVFDEIHVYSGQQGTHVANLSRRLKAYLKYLPPSDTEEKKDNPLPPILIGSSATIGNPVSVCSNFFGIREDLLKDRIFAPEVSEELPFGREYIFLLKTPPHRSVTLPSEDDESNRSRFVSEQASFLQGIMALWHCMPKANNKYKMLAFVDSIDSVWRIAKNLHDAESTKELYTFRLPAGRSNIPDSVLGGSYCPLRLTGQCISPPHNFYHPCEVYNSGECWWTMLSSPMVDPLRPMRVLANASGQRKDPSFARDLSLDEWDCLITTSTLEVGFDDPMLIATAQFKAPPNPASFQQRKGRGGRALEDTPMTLVVLGNSPGDLFAFRHEKRFFNPSSRDLEIAIDPRNPYVRKQHILSTIFDYLSWRGIIKHCPDIHKKCDIREALQYLDQDEFQWDLLRWIADMYRSDDVSENECRALLKEAIHHIRNSVIQLSSTMTMRGIHTSLDLYRRNEIPPEWIFSVEGRIREGKGGEIEQRTLSILQAADSFIKRRSGDGRIVEAYLHPPDYFSNLPVDNQGKHLEGSHVIPTSFVPTPIGGYINVRLDGDRVKKEPRLQILSTFLPGGFKNRWRFKLWYGTWKPVPGRSGYADISDLCRGGYNIGRLQDLLGNRPIPHALKMVGSGANLIEPREIAVRSGMQHFQLDSKEEKVALEEGEIGSRALLREPSSAVQTVDILSENPEAFDKKIVIENTINGFSRAYYGLMRLVRLFYANIVTAYLRDNSTKGMIVRFWDTERQEEAIPVSCMTTQGIRVTGSITKDATSRLKDRWQVIKMFEEHYWRNVYRFIWRVLLLGNGLNGLKMLNSFDCVTILQALKLMDYRLRVQGLGNISQLTQQEATRIALECTALCDKIDVGLFRKDSTEQRIIQVWEPFREEILKVAYLNLEEEIVESYTESVGRAISREIAGKTNSNIDLLEVSSEVIRKGESFDLTVSIYDRLEGGSGTVLSFTERTKNKLKLSKILERHGVCFSEKVERQVLNTLLNEKGTADVLYAKVQSDTYGVQSQGGIEIDPEARFRLRRILASPEITSFYMGVADNYDHLSNILDRAPTSAELAISLLERPIPDHRGLALTKDFSQIKGGIAELIPRVEEIIPICIGSCPDCLGDSRLSLRQGDTPIPDRYLIMADNSV